MKRNYRFIPAGIFILLLASSLVSITNAQRIFKVTSGVGTLNTAISGDTLATGERVDPNTIYELDRDGYYVLTSALTNVGYHLHIRAAEGNGKRPILRPGVLAGGESDRPFYPKGNLTLEGLYFTCLDEQNGLRKNIIRPSAPNLRIVIDDCQMDRDQQSAIRVDNSGMTIIIKNSIISNIGSMQSVDNGRAIDDRGNDIDTLILENNTFYNLSSTVLRDGGGIIKYLWMNHNTFVNIGQRGMDIGETIKTYICNNIFANCGFLGYPSSGQDIGNLEFSSTVITSKPLGTDYINQGYTQVMDIYNNNFYLNSEISNAYPDTVRTLTPFDSTSQAFVEKNGFGNKMINEVLTFTSGVQVPQSVAATYWSDASIKEEMNNGGGSPAYNGVQMPFDFSYPTSAQSYSWGTSSQPLGDLSYFHIQVGIENETQQLPGEFILEQNYPNPFNPETIINYSMPQSTKVELTIFNSLGQAVRNLVNAEQASGSHIVVWNGKNNAGAKMSSGIYFYTIKAGDFNLTKKMILMK